jgi:hypothetical protein
MLVLPTDLTMVYGSVSYSTIEDAVETQTKVAINLLGKPATGTTPTGLWYTSAEVLSVVNATAAAIVARAPMLWVIQQFSCMTIAPEFGFIVAFFALMSRQHNCRTSCYPHNIQPPRCLDRRRRGATARTHHACRTDELESCALCACWSFHRATTSRSIPRSLISWPVAWRESPQPRG